MGGGGNLTTMTKTTPDRPGVIYKITNKVNGKVYVGQTTATLTRRWREHKSDSRSKRKSHPYLHRAICKYGYASFTIEVIDSGSTKEELNAKEQEWIAKLSSADKRYGYNCTTGGGSCLHSLTSRAREKGGHWTEESRARWREAMKKQRGIPLSPDRKEALRLTRVGWKAGPETIAKMRVMQAHLWTPERRAEASRKAKERAATRKAAHPEINPKLSAAMKRIWTERKQNWPEHELHKKQLAVQKALWSDPAKRERERQAWTPERREAARQKSIAFFASPEGIEARKKISAKWQPRVKTEADRQKVIEAARKGWVTRKRNMQEAA